jgi:hypothetical protein
LRRPGWLGALRGRDGSVHVLGRTPHDRSDQVIGPGGIVDFYSSRAVDPFSGNQHVLFDGRFGISLIEHGLSFNSGFLFFAPEGPFMGSTAGRVQAVG